jgi:EPS-associated MarR family transcriptional regulator
MRFGDGLQGGCDVMPLSTKDFKVLDALDSEPISTQRQLSEHTGISLGQVNYVIRRFLERGLVKVSNFKKNKNKISYIYKLTPKGIETKSKLAVNFVVSRLKEYHHLQERLAERLSECESDDSVRLVFVGPEIVKEFIESIIQNKELHLRLVHHYSSVDGLQDLSPDTWDTALLFDANTENIRQIADETGLPREKLMMLW